jgi:shikimate 5-dehydrogenase
MVGINVTVPYKVKVIPYLNGLDATAARIGAVNTIVRAPGGQLVGFNTDGAGFLESIQKVLPGQEKPLMQGLKGMKVLIIGAGGSARAVAFSLAEVLDHGQLWICNRTQEPAASLAGDVQRTFPGARAVREEDLPRLAVDADLIVNCSTKGQGGMMRTAEGKVTILEPYSALAPAHPAVIEDPQKATAEIYRSWLKASLADIEGNNRASWRMMLSIPSEVPFCDLIYFPEETVFLRHARLSGHRSVNGRGMLACQAVESFFAICRTRLDEERLDPDETRRRVIESMWQMNRF